MGDKNDNQECAAKDDKSIDELVEFINGKTEKKKRRKKRRNAGQSDKLLVRSMQEHLD